MRRRPALAKTSGAEPRRPQPILENTVEGLRLAKARAGTAWRRWGPYLSERQWGTVREDYSANGTAWDYFPHDHARSRAYRWGEDGIGGFGDDQLRLCLSVALWNGRDPILKERLFGLTNAEGNHGEDVKELYYYLDGTPTHSYMRMLYKYPHATFPYTQLVEENRRRGSTEPEFELLDTGVFDEGRYFDVEITYAKADTDDILMEVTIRNRGAESAELRILPQLWARNIWSWAPNTPRPKLFAGDSGSINLEHPQLPGMKLFCDGAPELLFCENETNIKRLYGADASGFFKDGINDYIVHGDRSAVNPAMHGTKMAAHYNFTLPGHGISHVRVRLALARKVVPDPFKDFDTILEMRGAEADEFYEALQQEIDDHDARLVQRQALAGMLWSKQYLLHRHPGMAERRSGATSAARHLESTAAIATGVISTTPTSSRCRTSGSIPGTPPGISRFTV